MIKLQGSNCSLTTFFTMSPASPLPATSSFPANRFWVQKHKRTMGICRLRYQDSRYTADVNKQTCNNPEIALEIPDVAADSKIRRKLWNNNTVTTIIVDADSKIRQKLWNNNTVTTVIVDYQGLRESILNSKGNKTH